MIDESDSVNSDTDLPFVPTEYDRNPKHEKAIENARHEHANDDQRPPEDDEDSSEDEGLRNTIGNVPLHWYDDFDHIGYDRSGEMVAKSASKMDLVDRLLRMQDDPDYVYVFFVCFCFCFPL